MTAQFKQIAVENQSIVDAGRYEVEGGGEVEVAPVLAAAVKGTRWYGPHELTGPQILGGRVRQGGATAIEVTGEDTVTAARRLIAPTSAWASGWASAPAAATDSDSGLDSGSASGAGSGPDSHSDSTLASGPAPASAPASHGRVAVLNFASARHPGGGYLTGAKAQEEDLCRKTLLYHCLLAAPEYYEAHRGVRDPFYSHRLIYSPGVPVHRNNHNRLTAPMITVDVITCAAPNAGVLRRYRPEQVGRIPQQLAERAGVVLEAALRHGARRLVLGAWGCGVFRNDPRQVAAAFRTHLTGGGAYRDVFDQVTFAVLDRSAQQSNLRAFREAFEV